MRFGQMAVSAESTAQGKFEIVAWLDDDDPKADEYPDLSFVRYLHGPRETQSNLWNRCWEQAAGDIAMLCGDDVQFRTKGWAVRVNDAFDAYPDRLIMAYSRTGEPYVEATLPFVSREWIEVSGTFTPPYFRSWFADRWIWEVAESLGRDVFLRNVLIQHRRPRLKSPNLDQTYLDGERFRLEDDPESLYLSPAMLRERQEQAMRLCLAIEAAKAKPKRVKRTRERVAV